MELDHHHQQQQHEDEDAAVAASLVPAPARTAAAAEAEAEHLEQANHIQDAAPAVASSEMTDTTSASAEQGEGVAPATQAEQRQENGQSNTHDTQREEGEEEEEDAEGERLTEPSQDQQPLQPTLAHPRPTATSEGENPAWAEAAPEQEHAGVVDQRQHASLDAGVPAMVQDSGPRVSNDGTIEEAEKAANTGSDPTFRDQTALLRDLAATLAAGPGGVGNGSSSGGALLSLALPLQNGTDGDPSASHQHPPSDQQNGEAVSSQLANSDPRSADSEMMQENGASAHRDAPTPVARDDNDVTAAREQNGRLEEHEETRPQDPTAARSQEKKSYPEGVNPCLIFIGGLPDDTEIQDLQDCFGQFGELVYVEMISGHAFVEYETPEAAQEAIDLYDGGHFLGAQIKVELVRPRIVIADEEEEKKPEEKAPEQPKCFICNGIGHSARQCPDNKRYNAKPQEGKNPIRGRPDRDPWMRVREQSPPRGSLRNSFDASRERDYPSSSKPKFDYSIDRSYETDRRGSTTTSGFDYSIPPSSSASHPTASPWAPPPASFSPPPPPPSARYQPYAQLPPSQTPYPQYGDREAGFGYARDARYDAGPSAHHGSHRDSAGYGHAANTRPTPSPYYPSPSTGPPSDWGRRENGGAGYTPYPPPPSTLPYSHPPPPVPPYPVRGSAPLPPPPIPLPPQLASLASTSSNSAAHPVPLPPPSTLLRIAEGEPQKSEIRPYPAAKDYEYAGNGSKYPPPLGPAPDGNRSYSPPQNIRYRDEPQSSYDYYGSAYGGSAGPSSYPPPPLPPAFAPPSLHGMHADPYHRGASQPSYQAYGSPPSGAYNPLPSYPAPLGSSRSGYLQPDSGYS